MFDDFKSIIKHSVVYGMGGMLGKVVGFILLPLYTHYLSTSEYGTLELLELTTYIVGMFLAAGISQSLFRFYYDTEIPEEKNEIVSTALVAIWVISLSGFVVIALFSSSVSNIVFGSSDYTGLFRLVFLGLMFSLTGEIPMSFIRAQQKSVLFTTISLVKLIINLILNILFIVGFGWGIRGIILSALTTQSVISIIFSIYVIKICGFHFSLSKFSKMFKYGSPMIPAGLGYFILNFADRFILQRFTSLSDVGIYSLGYKFGMIMSSVIAQPFMLIWQAKMFEIAKKENAKKFFSLIFTYFMFVEIFFGLSLSIIIIDALKIISSPEYYNACFIVPIIAFSYILSGAYFYMQLGLLITKKTKYIAYIVIIIAAINMGLNFLLIPRIGIWGAAYSTVISYGLLCIFNYYVTQKIYYIKYQILRVFKLFIVALALYVLAFYVKVDNFIISITIKFIISLSYPIVLYLVKFYEPDELIKIKELIGELVIYIKGKISKTRISK
ncbi:MAG: oligosaccharide flippase family protein [candidate division Zixibacteria bacterium]|nr:oligosaccharide flippase family protein [candidate division Zixibacteria bacterium]